MKNILILVVFLFTCGFASAKTTTTLLDSAKHIVEESQTLNPSIKNINLIYTDSLYRFKVGDQIIDHKIKQGEGANRIVLSYLSGNYTGSEVTGFVETSQEEDAFKEEYPVPNGISNMIPLSKDTASQYSKKEREAMQLHAEQVREGDAKLYKIYGILVAFVLLIASYKIWKERRDKSRLAAASAIAEEENQKTEMVDMLEEPYGVTQTAHQYEWATVEQAPATYNYLSLLAKVAASLMFMLLANNASAGNGDIVFQINFVAIVLFILGATITILFGSTNTRRQYVRIPEEPMEKPITVTAIKLWRENESKGTIESFFEELREYNKQYGSE